MPRNIHDASKSFSKKPCNSIYVALFVQALRVVLIAKIKGYVHIFSNWEIFKYGALYLYYDTNYIEEHRSIWDLVLVFTSSTQTQTYKFEMAKWDGLCKRNVF